MKSQTLLAYAIVAFASVILTKAADNVAGVPLGGGHSPIQIDWAAIAKMSSPELQKTLTDIGYNEQAMEREIDSKLADTNPKQVRIAAVFIAGQYRLLTCASALAKMSDFPGNVHDGAHDPAGDPLDEYPVGIATWRLGDSMIVPFLENIAISDNAEVRKDAINFLQNYQRVETLNSKIHDVEDDQTKVGNAAGAARLKAIAPQLLNPPAE
jgi:hypothetical protein